MAKRAKWHCLFARMLFRLHTHTFAVRQLPVQVSSSHPRMLIRLHTRTFASYTLPVRAITLVRTHARSFACTPAVRKHTAKIFQYQFLSKKTRPRKTIVNRLVGSAAAHMVLAVAMRGALLSASIRFIELYSQGKSVDASTLIRCTP